MMHPSNSTYNDYIKRFKEGSGAFKLNNRVFLIEACPFGKILQSIFNRCFKSHSRSAKTQHSSGGTANGLIPPRPIRTDRQQDAVIARLYECLGKDVSLAVKGEIRVVRGVRCTFYKSNPKQKALAEALYFLNNPENVGEKSWTRDNPEKLKRLMAEFKGTSASPAAQDNWETFKAGVFAILNLT
jgi:hypothetical protein